jgi:hypothetical protein
VFQAHRQSPSPRRLQKHAKSQGPLLRWRYPASTLIRPCPTPAMAVAFRNVEAATLATVGSPPITRTTFPTCRAYYPGGSSGCPCRLLPAPVGTFPVWQEGRHPHCHFRGLLRLHSRYGPPDRSATQGDLCHVGAARMRPFVVAPGGCLNDRSKRQSGTSVSGHPTMWPIVGKTKQSGKESNSVLDGSPFHAQWGHPNECLWT